MAQISCRVPAAVEDTLQAAADERGVFKSDLIRQAIRYYVQENPDELAVLANGLETTDDSNRRLYDPVEELAR